ncbi:MAG: AAA family ATPase [Burkholderiales bacterium]|uniref:AAA family ATPase n=1 Tax=Nitrosomonas sp. TaxID=42353 RepID=UPI001D9BDA51|nr:AAA family ATPase [Nitrosomonas sp.]MCB1949671.1 AAA family ATPase [Nitrosomonas sp.]MCP5242492.1 AAA family ATPase [Burkholderiales bacterium]
MTYSKTGREAFTQLCDQLEQQIIGQQSLVQRLLLTLLCDGHLLLEGAPGLAKTRAIKSLAGGLEADFHRIQFTPDLLPADLTGTDVYHPETGSFSFNKGPLFHNVILADEINRAPAKVQSALLEAMEERQVTVGAASYPLSPLFLVMATQNPIEQEGTYPLPEAQLDRFLLHVRVDYPDKNASRKILQLVRHEALCALDHSAPRELQKVTQEQVFAARREIMQLHLAEAVEDYIVEIIETTRNPGQYGQELSSWIRWGASPRGAIAIERAARATAWLAEREFVTPEDVQKVTPDALRHRILLNYEAEAEGITAQQCIDQIIASVPAP